MKTCTTICFCFTSQVSKSPGKQINFMCFKFGPADLRSKSMMVWYIISATWSLGYPSCPVPMAGNTRVVQDESLASSKHFLINSIRTYWKFRFINNCIIFLIIIFELFRLRLLMGKLNNQNNINCIELSYQIIHL